MKAKRQFAVRRYDGDDIYSWAIFAADEVAHVKPNRPVWYGEVRPLETGLTRKQAMMKVRLAELNRAPCQWFLGCTNKSVEEKDHPTLGKVPICDRCLSWCKRQEKSYIYRRK